MTLAALRGIQGIGAAAMVPAGVSPCSTISILTSDQPYNPARNSC